MAQYARKLDNEIHAVDGGRRRAAARSGAQLVGRHGPDTLFPEEGFGPSLPLHTQLLLTRWRELESGASLRASLVESAASDLPEGEVARFLGCLVSDVRDVGDVLAAMQSDLRDCVDRPMIPAHAWFGYVEQVYGWLHGLLDQVSETLASSGEDADSFTGSMRSLVEFSSLYVRGLLEPAHAATVELHWRAGDPLTQELLSALDERIHWLGVTVETFGTRSP